jgi:hypothetical protein
MIRESVAGASLILIERADAPGWWARLPGSHRKVGVVERDGAWWYWYPVDGQRDRQCRRRTRRRACEELVSQWQAQNQPAQAS